MCVCVCANLLADNLIARQSADKCIYGSWLSDGGHGATALMECNFNAYACHLHPVYYYDDCIR